MKNFIKSKILPVIMSGALLVTNLAGLTANVAYAAVPAESNKFESKFETGIDWSVTTTKQNMVESAKPDGYIYGNSMRFNPTTDIQYANKVISGIEGKGAYTVSFDFMLPQTDHFFKMFIRSGNAVDEGAVDMTALAWDQNGYVYASLNGHAPHDITTGYKPDASNGFDKIGEFAANEWHSISVTVNPDNANSTLDWYYDGKFVFTAICDFGNAKKTNGYMNNIYICGMQTANSGFGIASTEVLDYDGSECIYFDNMQVTLDNEYYFYGYSDENTEDGKKVVKYNFTEGVADAELLDRVKVINGETGEAATITNHKHNSRSGAFEVTSDTIEGAEYFLQFPDELRGGSGRELMRDMSVYIANTKIIPENQIGSADDMTINNDGSKLNTWVADAKNLKESDTAEFANDNGGDYIVTFDYEALSDPVGGMAVIYLYATKISGVGQPTYLSSICADDSGKISTNINGSWLENIPISPSDDNWQDGGNVFVKGKKTSFMYYINRKTRKTELYTKGEDESEYTKIAESKAPLNEKYAISPHKVVAYTKSTDGSKFRFKITNIKAYNQAVAGNRVSSLRTENIDGTEGVPFTANTKSTADAIKIKFNCDVDTSTINDANIVLTAKNGGNVPNYMVTNDGSNGAQITWDTANGYLTRGEEYEVSVTGIKTADKKDVKDYGTTIKVNDYSEFTIADINKSTGANVDLTANIINSTDDDKTVKAMLVSENDGEMTVLSEQTFIATANQRTDVSGISVTKPADSNSKLYTIFTDENNIPYNVSNVEEMPGTMTDDVWRVNTKLTDAEFANKLVYAEVTNADNAKVAYRTLLKADENGKCDFSFRMSDNVVSEGVYKMPSGEYMVNYYCENGKTASGKIEFSNITEAKEIVTDIKTSAEDLDLTKEQAIAEIKTVLENKKFALGISIDGYENADTDKIAETVYNYIKDGGDFEADADAAVTKTKAALSVVQKAAVAGCTAEGIITNMFDFADVLELENSDIKDFYKSDFVTENLQKSVTSGLKTANGYAKLNGFYDSLNVKFVLETVKDADGVDNLKAVLNHFASDIGITKDASNNVYRALSGKTYTSYDEVKTAFNTAKKKYDESNGGGNGGGTLTGPSNFGGVEINGIEKNEETESIDKNIFSDLEGFEWATDAIVTLAEKKIINGKGDFKFAPGDNITRAELAKMLVVAFIDPNNGGVQAADCDFIDVSKDDWSYSYIGAAAKAGFVNGYEDGSFKGDENITREDAALMIYRAATTDKVAFTNEIVNHFYDEESISDYALEGVNAMYNQGFINGTGDGMFTPKNNATRAEIAKIIYNVIIGG